MFAINLNGRTFVGTVTKPINLFDNFYQDTSTPVLILVKGFLTLGGLKSLLEGLYESCPIIFGSGARKMIYKFLNLEL